MNQDSNKPVPKVAAVATSGGIVTAIVVVLALFGVELPQEVQDNIGALVAGVVALTSLVNFAAGYFKKSNVKEV